MKSSTHFDLIDENIISKTIASEMDSRLRFVKIKPSNIIVMGADFFNSINLLTQRYPSASLLEIDPNINFLQKSQKIAKKQTSFWQKLSHKTPKQLHQPFQTPLVTNNTDVLWSNLSIQTENDLKNTFENWSKSLKTDGMLFMTSFGPDTLKEVFDLLQQNNITVDRQKLWDMHDMGDMLAMGGFIQPITDMSKLVIDYQNPTNFWVDMASLRLFDSFKIDCPEETYHKIISDAFTEGTLKNITLEIIYAHALKGPPLDKKEQVINFYPKT